MCPLGSLKAIWHPCSRPTHLGAPDHHWSCHPALGVPALGGRARLGGQLLDRDRLHIQLHPHLDPPPNRMLLLCFNIIVTSSNCAKRTQWAVHRWDPSQRVLEVCFQGEISCYSRKWRMSDATAEQRREMAPKSCCTLNPQCDIHSVQ